MGKRGPKTREIDFNQLDKLLELHLPISNIAYYFDVTEKTIQRRVKKVTGKKYVQYAQQKAQKGVILLLNQFWNGVRNGTPSFIIFGLKNRLGWSDNITLQNGMPKRGFHKIKSKKVNE